MNPKIDELLKKVLADKKQALRILIPAGLAVVFVLVLLPLQSRASRVAKTLAAQKADVDKARVLGIQSLKPDEIVKLQGRIRSFKGGFITISEVAAILDTISDEAGRHHVEVLSLKSDAPLALSDREGKGLAIDGVSLSRLPIHLKVRGGYRPLASFLNAWKRSSKRVFIVEFYEITKTAPENKGQSLLEAEMAVSFFLKNP